MEATVEKQFDPVPCQRSSEITTRQNLIWDLGSPPKITLLLENITEAEMCFHMGGNWKLQDGLAFTSLISYNIKGKAPKNNKKKY